MLDCTEDWVDKEKYQKCSFLQSVSILGFVLIIGDWKLQSWLWTKNIAAATADNSIKCMMTRLNLTATVQLIFPNLFQRHDSYICKKFKLNDISLLLSVYLIVLISEKYSIWIICQWISYGYNRINCISGLVTNLVGLGIFTTLIYSNNNILANSLQRPW